MDKPDSASSSPRANLSQVALVLLAGLLLRLFAFGGIGGSDDMAYAGAAERILRGSFVPEYFGFEARYGQILPVALSFALLGISEASLVLFPLMCSLGTILVSYLIGLRMADHRSGIIASLLMATLPIDVLGATTLFPDIPVSAAVSLSFLLLLEPRGHVPTPSIRSGTALLAGAALGYGIMIKITAGFVLPCLLLLLVRCNRATSSSRKLALFTAGVLLILTPAMVFDVSTTGYIFPRLYPGVSQIPSSGPWTSHTHGGIWVLLSFLLLEAPGWFLNPLGGPIVFFGTLGILGAAGALHGLIWNRRSAWPLIAWILSYYLLLFAGVSIASWILKGNEGVFEHQIRYLSPLLPSLAVLAALMLSKHSHSHGWALSRLVLVFCVILHLLFVFVLWRNEVVPRDLLRQAAATLRGAPKGPVYADPQLEPLLRYYGLDVEDGHPAQPIGASLAAIPRGSYVIIDEARIDAVQQWYGGYERFRRDGLPETWVLLWERQFPVRQSIRGTFFGRAPPPSPPMSVLIFRVES